MANNINGIGINSGSVNPYVNPKPQGEPKAGDKPENNTPQPQGANVNPDDVLTYLANNAVYVAPVSTPKTYDVEKYVTPEQAARIAGFIGEFEDEVANGLLALNKEFGEGLSEAAKLELAARMAGNV